MNKFMQKVAKMKIMVIDGPNMNLMGKREVGVYGAVSLDQIQTHLKAAATNIGEGIEVSLEFFQSNLEGELVDKIQECLGTVDGIIINPAAYTHTSVAIRDAIIAVGLPCIEVHVSNTARREEFRQQNYISAACHGTITGFGPFGYHLALMGLVQAIEQFRAMVAKQKGE